MKTNPQGSMKQRQFNRIIPKHWRWICLRWTQDTDVTAYFAPNHFNVVPSVLLRANGSNRFCTKQSERTLITLSLWRHEARRDQKRKAAEFQKVSPGTYRKTGVGKAWAGQRTLIPSPMVPRMTWIFSPVLIFGATDPTGSFKRKDVLLPAPVVDSKKKKKHESLSALKVLCLTQRRLTLFLTTSTSWFYS